MNEATGFEAKTIHRLLEVDPRTGGFRRAIGEGETRLAPRNSGISIAFADSSRLAVEKLLRERCRFVS